MNNVYGFRFAAMGSKANEVKLNAPDQAQAHGLSQLAIQEVLRIEAKYSRYRPDSVLSQLNLHSQNDWFECDAETSALLSYADALHQSSEGLFDLSSGVLRRAWKFDSSALPDPQLLNQLKQTIGWEHIERQGNQIRFTKPGIELDLGGIAKEYAADRASAILKSASVDHGFVNLAGDLSVLGPQPDLKPWSIAIAHPRIADKILASIEVTQGGIATSGDYERYFELNGKRYCHVLNPKTGYPVSYWQSVTVVAPTTSVAGSCSSIAMLLEKKGLSFLQSTGFQFLAIDSTGKMHRFPH
jgi:FAD:protein FMN transferase